MSTPILATWICIDNEKNASFFPSTKGKSSDLSIQAIYWKCLAVCMYSARLYNPSIRLIVFSNTSILPTIGNHSFEKIFSSLNVEFHVTPFEYETPSGYYGSWKNQFYEFSIFKYVTTNDIIADDAPFVLIDSDCFISNNLADMFADIEKNGCINYDLELPVDEMINGITRADMKKIYESLLQRTIDKTPIYYAGEYIGIKKEKLKILMNEFYQTWPQLLSLHKNNELRLNEEAHVLSYLYFKINCENNFANRYVKRIWTDPTTFRNAQKRDIELGIWHVPAEKRTGFNQIYNTIEGIEFSTTKINADDFRKYAATTLQVTGISFSKKIYYVIKRIIKKILKK